MSDYWEDKKKSPNFQDWMGELHGSILCDCGHGCRDWISNNGGKALTIINALKSGANEAELDAIVQKHTDEIGKAIWDSRVPVKMGETQEDTDLSKLYPKYNCPSCGDWFHMPYKYCKCTPKTEK